MTSEFTPDPSTDSSQPSSPQEYVPIGDAIDLSEDVYERIVQQVQEICQFVTTDTGESIDANMAPERTNLESTILEKTALKNSTERVHPAAPEPVRPPEPPQSLEQAGLSLSQLSDLILKLIYLNGSLTGFDIAKQIRLPFSVVDDGLAFLKDERCLEVSSGELAGRLSYRFLLTDHGRKRAREAFDECRYVGPAPVSLESYREQCLRQSTRNIGLSPSEIRHAFRDLVLDETLVSRIGPAILSGQSMFLFGSPGNGKTVLAKAIGALMNECGGDIYVPYSVTVDRHIITVFDPSLHQSVVAAPEVSLVAEMTPVINDNGEEFDQRWRRITRPVVMTGGELSLGMLDLKYHSNSGFYTAPLHMKSNGGVFLLDDFGRQLVPPAELLNRWILPLEEKHDYLTLSTGKKFLVPFEQLIIFSTNLSPTDLVDEAFLRRIRHKIPISAPSESQFREIFRRCCEQKGVAYDDWIVTQLLRTQSNEKRPPKSSDPRDLLDIMQSICRFREEKFHLSEDILSEAWRECHGGLHHSGPGEVG